jgi:hypothetical protein
MGGEGGWEGAFFPYCRNMSDPFDIFDVPSPPGRAADPFDIFDAPAPPAAPASKRAKTPSPVLPLVRRFVSFHHAAVCADLAANRERLPAALSLASELNRAAECIVTEPPKLDVARKAAQLASDTAWEVIKASDDSTTQPLCREAYVIAEVVLCGVIAATDEGDVAGALRSLDRAFILGGPTDLYRDCVELLDDCPSSSEDGATLLPPPPSQMPRCPPSSIPGAAGLAATPAPGEVERCPCPPSAEAFRQAHRAGVPLVLEGIANGWPALTKWSNFDWLRSQHGHRLVPVEVGALAGAEKAAWGERIMPLAEFIDAHLSEATRATSGGGIGYLAQHPLFEQIPRLRRDFSVPALCSVGTLQHVNAWLGPAGTVTPLHFDSYHNVLTQVAGHKRVRLYDARQTPLLYPKDAGGTGVDAQGNVSAVDVEAPDLERYPDFARAVCTETVLGPGEGLYIPAGVWHHVRSLTTSFSVSFWF